MLTSNSQVGQATVILAIPTTRAVLHRCCAVAAQVVANQT